MLQNQYETFGTIIAKADGETAEGRKAIYFGWQIIKCLYMIPYSQVEFQIDA